jgi:hypothetical protein
MKHWEIIAGVHLKGVQEIVQRHAELYVGRDQLESSHWRGRSGSERNHHDDDGQN